MPQQTIAQALREMADGLTGTYVHTERLYTVVRRLEEGACGSDPVSTLDEPTPPPPGDEGPGIGGGGGKAP
jgi:hypothetical protein